MVDSNQENQQENKGSQTTIGGDWVGGHKITIGDITASTVTIELGDRPQPLTGERAEEIKSAYLEKVKDKWREIEAISGARFPLTKVYVMVQAARSRRPKETSQRPDIDPAEERQAHSGMRELSKALGFEKDASPPLEMHPSASPVPLGDALKDQQHMVLLGEPGAGKSVSLQYVGFYFASKGDPARPNLALAEERLPLLLPLKSYSDLLQSQPLVAALASELRQAMPLVDVTEEEALACIQRWSKEGQLAILLDGLDEVQEEKRPEITQAIRDFARETSARNCRIVVASRTASYRRDLGEPFREYTLKPFSREEAIPYVASWLAALDPAADSQAEDARDKADWLISEMGPGSELEYLLDNSLLLHMVVETFVETGDLVRNRFSLYTRFVDDVAKPRAYET